VLVDEIIKPLFSRPDVESLDVFLLSNLNLERRDRHDLDLLRREGEPWLWELVEQCCGFASVRTVGSYLERNVEIATNSRPRLTLVLGCRTADDVGCREVDLFLRSGGELRLSGAPRTIIGDYTQLYAIDALHPEVRYADVEECLERYRSRYIREAQPT
jgi:hypothetical protein